MANSNPISNLKSQISNSISISVKYPEYPLRRLKIEILIVKKTASRPTSMHARFARCTSLRQDFDDARDNFLVQTPNDARIVIIDGSVKLNTCMLSKFPFFALATPYTVAAISTIRVFNNILESSCLVHGGVGAGPHEKQSIQNNSSGPPRHRQSYLGR